MQVGDSAHLILQDDDVFGLGTLDAVDGYAMVMEPFELAVYGCCSHAARDEADLHLFEFLDRKFCQVGRFAQGTDNIVEAVALIKLSHSIGLTTDDLEYDLHSAGSRIIVADGQRHSLTLIIHTNDQKLTGKRVLRDPGSLHVHQKDVRSKIFLFKNPEHVFLLL